MSGNGLGGRPRVPHEASDGTPDERAPVFGHWGLWYLLVVLDLAIVIALCAWITHLHR
jgi:hypothetical protein